MVGQNPASLEVDVLGVVGGKGDGQQAEPGFLRGASGLAVVASLAGGDRVGPFVPAAARQWRHMIPGKLVRREGIPTVETELGVPSEQGTIAQGRNVVAENTVVECTIGTCRQDGMDRDAALLSGHGIGAAMDVIEHPSEGCTYLAQAVQLDGFLVADPLERHSRRVGAEHLLVQGVHVKDCTRFPAAEKSPFHAFLPPSVTITPFLHRRVATCDCLFPH